MPAAEAPVTVPYTLFKEEVGKGNVEAIYSRGETITGRFKAPVTYPPPDEKSAAPDGRAPNGERTVRRAATSPNRSSTFTTTLPAFVDPGLEAFLIDHGVEISAEPIEKAAARGRRCCSASARPCSSSGSTSGCSGGRRSRAAAWAAGSWASARARRAATTRRRTRRSPSTTSPASTKPRTSWSRSSISSGIRQKYTRLGGDRAEGRAAGRRAGHRQDPAGEGGRGRGGRAVLLDERARSSSR